MPRDLSGNYTLPATNPVTPGTVIETTWANPTLADIAAQLNGVITRDGLLGPTANLPMAGLKHTGAADASASGEYATYDQLLAAQAIPVTPVSAAYTITPADAWRSLRHPAADVTARIWTVQLNATSPYEEGTLIMLVNKNGAGVITITPTDTMRLAGSGATGNRTLDPNGVAIMLWDAVEDEWLIYGTGLS